MGRARPGKRSLLSPGAGLWALGTAKSASFLRARSWLVPSVQGHVSRTHPQASLLKHCTAQLGLANSQTSGIHSVNVIATQHKGPGVSSAE